MQNMTKCVVISPPEDLAIPLKVFKDADASVQASMFPKLTKWTRNLGMGPECLLVWTTARTLKAGLGALPEQ